MPNEGEDANPRVPEGVDGLQKKHGEEWEPAGALREALGKLPLRPVTGPGDELAGHLLELRAHAEEALGALGRLERGRGLSEAERTRAAALRRLLALAEGVE
jgi:hypothetical protein